MYETAYIALDQEGHVTLFWGDGTEPYKEVIHQGPRPASSEELIDLIEDLKAWAEDQGYTVIVPAYDLEVPDIEIDLSDDDPDITLDDVDDLIDDLLMAEDEDLYRDEDDEEC